MSRAVEESNRRMPTERPYGIDCVLRDPFGNNIHIGQLAPATQPATPWTT
jgi:hypothetical protein